MSILLRFLPIGTSALTQSEPGVAMPQRKPNRRWFQFSLRSLIVFTIGCAVAAGWLGKKLEQKRKEREAVEALVKRHATVRYDYWGTQNAAPHGPAWLRKLLGENFFSD